MRARIKKNQDFSAAMALVFGAVILYSVWGAAVLHGRHQANAQKSQLASAAFIDTASAAH